MRQPPALSGHLDRHRNKLGVSGRHRRVRQPERVLQADAYVPAGVSANSMTRQVAIPEPW